MSGRRIELSATQVIASMLAAVTGAVAASYAGIAGTVIGVAVMSVASTAGAAVYKHYLGRSQERLRSAAEVIAPLASFNSATVHRARRAAGHPARAPGDRADAAGTSADAVARPADGARTAAAGHPVDGVRTGALPIPAAGQISNWPWSPDSPVTDEFPAISDREITRCSDLPAETAGPTDPQGPATDPQGRGTDPQGRGTDPQDPGTDTGQSTGTDAGPSTRTDTSEPSAPRTARRRWPAFAGAALGVFVLTLGGITAVEVAAGKPLDSLIWGRSGGGTTVGDFTGAQHARHGSGAKPDPATPAPAGKPTGTPSRSPTPSTSPSPSQSPSPSPSPASSSTGRGSASPSAAATHS